MKKLMSHLVFMNLKNVLENKKWVKMQDLT